MRALKKSGVAIIDCFCLRVGGLFGVQVNPAKMMCRRVTDKLKPQVKSAEFCSIRKNTLSVLPAPSFAFDCSHTPHRKKLAQRVQRGSPTKTCQNALIVDSNFRCLFASTTAGAQIATHLKLHEIRPMNSRLFPSHMT